MAMVVRKAKQEDLLKVQRLVAKAGLRDEGIEHIIEHFLIVENDAEQLIGTVGIEMYEEVGLLRSLVLQSPEWDAKLSLEFLQLTLKYAEEQKLKAVYLCAKATSALFHQLGFREVVKERIPKEIQESAHFKKHQTADVKIWCCPIV
ncbi:hypothetical protein [Halalkalibacter hemicellulosilyticus]|uniref:N-acetyltransferase domain-containing protein n=1 Tax=Halalkalibacter hemicellulosilyticusJCM 9152 TaxID=1236971 RepID=W4QGQ2_9BACI|nr:hypothetical protein [Halalkalibacter hemicellulosilyticus]GAE31290.1 hypothetical protein JCM9152_2747 [Halalkalibacter hemicellulosilyticusJCM 9152]